MTKFYDAFQDFTVEERRQIAQACGTTLGYLSKHMYTSGREPKFRFHNAVNLERASAGALPFWQHTEGDVDWTYVLRRLQRAKRRGELT